VFARRDPEPGGKVAVLGYNYPGSKWYEDGYKLMSKSGNLGTKT
jgi:hypothetical protein